MSEYTHVITYSQKHTEEINKLDYVGLWVITSSFRIRVHTKPHWFHRQMARIFFGWGWEDKEGVTLKSKYIRTMILKELKFSSSTRELGSPG